MDYKAVGSTVNLVARMEQTAAPGTIRISARANPETIASSPLPLMDLEDLSPREIDVLRLMAAGKSHQEIADVFISRNTVSTHVRNILTKSGCANRTEAAAYAMRHGLSEA